MNLLYVSIIKLYYLHSHHMGILDLVISFILYSAFFHMNSWKLILTNKAPLKGKGSTMNPRAKGREKHEDVRLLKDLLSTLEPAYLFYYFEF